MDHPPAIEALTIRLVLLVDVEAAKFLKQRSIKSPIRGEDREMHQALDAGRRRRERRLAR